MTQQELGGIRFSKSYISLIEKDKVKPSISALEYISERLNKQISYFIEDETSTDNLLHIYNSLKQIVEGENLIKEMEYDRAEEIFNELLNQIEIFSDYHKGVINYNYGLIMFKTKDTNDYQIFINKSLTVFEQILDSEVVLDKVELLDCYIKIADIHYILNNKSECLKYYMQAKNFEEKEKINKEQYYNVLRCLSILFTHEGDYNTSIKYSQKIIDMSMKDQTINTTTLRAYLNLANCHMHLKEYNDALLILEKIIPIYTIFNNSIDLAKTYFKISKIYTELQDYKLANKYIVLSLKHGATIKDDEIKKHCQLFNKLQLAKIKFYTHKSHQALKEISEILSEVNSIEKINTDFMTLLAGTKALSGRIHFSSNNLEEAEKDLLKSIEMFQKIKVKNQLPNIYKLLGEIYIKTSQPLKAQTYYEKALDILDDKNFSSF